MHRRSVTTRELAQELSAELVGDASREVTHLAPIGTADAQAVAFLAHPKYRQQAEGSAAGCLILPVALADLAQVRAAAGLTSLLVADPYVTYARLTQWWRANVLLDRMPAGGMHPSAVVEAGAQVASSAWVGPLCVVESGASVAAGAVLTARVHIGRGVSVGERCVLHPGVVVGADGFGFANDHGRWIKIEQLGGVRIGNDVELGANTCVDRGALGDTVIEDGVKIDNLVQVAHNVFIGAHTAIAGCVGIAGSAHIGARCTIGGGAVVLGHLSLADDVHISAASVVTRSLNRPGTYSGFFPIDDNASWEKNAASLRQLNVLRERVRSLERQNKA